LILGCGGLSIGLEQSGVAKCRWAIEWDADAAQAFKTNHSEDCKVVVDDVNKVLREIMDQGSGDDERANFMKEKQLPQKGEVELMCGGPPCQGFSVMNTFHEGDKARFKNSLIATYLSFCDYFRPSYFILENVKNFAQFNGGRILILCMRALVMMGYQCQFGVLQAGNFGVAQNRKRAILLAAAPNCPLPHFPAIMNVFEQMPLTINVDDKSFDVNSNHWRNNSAPYRNMTARDAISDLADTNKGGQKVLCDDPVTWLQRTIRWCHKKQTYISQVSHHEEKGTSEIVMARIACIPKTLGADWRDLPNKCVDLPSGRKATKIKYPYIDIKTKKPAVCSCSTKQGQCRVMDRQDYTLIPFALVHKAKNHSQWKNCYGRVHWDTYFSTTTTNIHPEGKQGRVLHPEQDRVLSVRECARSQGFPDYAEFCGSIHDKYKQIGNAVPPPMARALGISILCAQAETESLKLLY
jgi:DNA (cytosine-5)-methyltransferase 1